MNAWQRSFRYILLPKKHVYSLMPSLDPPTSLHSVQIVSLVHVRFCVNLSISPPHVQSRPGKLNAVCICVWANCDIKEAFCTYTVCGSPMWKSKVIVSNTFTNCKFKCCITKGGAYASIESSPTSKRLKRAWVRDQAYACFHRCIRRLQAHVSLALNRS